ncbi:MAG: radical SAM protein [Deltaproteobacteria bacterium]|nr:radical SAM protein [Deltaproteobacteria bacterium]
MKYIFGPVPSRRLGWSLGLDILPYKTCSFDCIYCELGPTTCRTIDPIGLIEPGAVLAELESFLAAHPEKIDFLTISGSGEPTLHPELGSLIRELKRHYTLPVALITNASLFFRPQVLEQVRAADLIIPSLDAVDPETLAAVNRPHPDLDHKSLLEGLLALGRLKGPRLWLEILLIKGLNDHPDQIDRFKQLSAAINPEKIQINTVVRPPVESWALPLETTRLAQIREQLGPQAEIIARPDRQSDRTIRWEDEIIKLVSRRPCTAEDLAQLTGWPPDETLALLQRLIAGGKITAAPFNQEMYYRCRTLDT